MNKKKLDRGGYFQGRPGPGRPTKTDYGSPDAPAELRVFVRDPAGRRDMALRAAQEVDGWGCARLLDAVADVAG